MSLAEINNQPYPVPESAAVEEKKLIKPITRTLDSISPINERISGDTGPATAVAAVVLRKCLRCIVRILFSIEEGIRGQE